MIQDLMRKHRRAILLFVVLVIAVPFVLFFGMPGRSRPTVEFKDTPVATVAGLPILESEYRRGLNALIQQRSMPDKPATIEDLEKSGELDKLLQQLVDGNLIKIEEQKRNFKVARNLLIEQMQEWNHFKTEDGKFDREAWNAWIETNRDKINWNELYADLQESVSRQVYLNAVLAPARFDPFEVEKKVKNEFTKIRIKYANISPPIEPTEEELSKYFEEHKEIYREPDTLVVESIRVSLEPPVPDKAIEAYNRAKNGEDFATLADELSDQKTKNGGDMGWQSPRENDPPHRKLLFTLPVGEINEPIYTFGAYYIFKVEEERTNETTGMREVRARQIMIRASLDDEEKKKREELANELTKQANEAKSLEKIAEEKGYTIMKIGPFNRESTTIEGVGHFDVYTFRASFTDKEKDNEYQTITCRDNIYIAKVLERQMGEIPPMDKVRDRVLNDFRTVTKNKDEYAQRVNQMVEKIKAEAKSIDDIPNLFPEMNIEVKETETPFTAKDYLFSQGLRISTDEIFKLVADKEPGYLGGPIKDFASDYYMIQLLEITPPSEEDKSKMEEEKKKKLDMELRMAQNEILEDYRLFLREQAMKRGVPIKIDQNKVNSILGKDKDSESKEEKKDTGSTASDLEKLNALIGD